MTTSSKQDYGLVFDYIHSRLSNSPSEDVLSQAIGAVSYFGQHPDLTVLETRVKTMKEHNRAEDECYIIMFEEALYQQHRVIQRFRQLSTELGALLRVITDLFGHSEALDNFEESAPSMLENIMQCLLNSKLSEICFYIFSESIPLAGFVERNKKSLPPPPQYTEKFLRANENCLGRQIGKIVDDNSDDGIDEDDDLSSLDRSNAAEALEKLDILRGNKINAEKYKALHICLNDLKDRIRNLERKLKACISSPKTEEEKKDDVEIQKTLNDMNLEESTVNADHEDVVI